MERDEAPDEAAVRETFEETGLRVRPDYVVGVYRLDSGYVIYVFRCSQAGAVRAQGANDEIAEVVWSDIDAIPTPVTNTLDYALPDIVKGERGVVREGLPHR